MLALKLFCFLFFEGVFAHLRVDERVFERMRQDVPRQAELVQDGPQNTTTPNLTNQTVTSQNPMSLDGNEFVDDDDLPFSIDWAKIKTLFMAHRNSTGGKTEAPRNETARKVHVHIHKTGGTFMCGLAQQHEEIPSKVRKLNCNIGYDDYHYETGGSSTKCDKRRHEMDASGATYTQIEQPLSEGNFDCSGFTQTIILRDPISRMCSHSHMIGDDDFGSMFSGGGAALVKAAIHANETNSGWRKAWQFLDNYHVRIIADAMHVRAGEINEEHVRAAQEKLKNFHVATLEKQEGMAKTIANAFGWPDFGPALTPKPVQVYTQCKSQMFGTEEDLVELKRLNKFDYMLYEAYAR